MRNLENSSEITGTRRRSRFPIRQLTLLVVVLLALGLGFAFGNDYGSSTDEPSNALVGKDALKAFRDRHGYLDYLEHKEVLAHHGPSYFIVYHVASNFFDRLIPGWHEIDGRHFTNYLTHLMGAIFFYYLARRFLEWPYALLSAVFFATQPMLLGHAFINQKDTPFMAFFIACVAIGMIAADRVARASPSREGEGDSLWRMYQDEWKSLSSVPKGVAVAVATASLILVVDVLFLQNLLQWAKQVLTAAYSGQAWGPINQLFQTVAEDASTATLDDYLFRLRWLYWRSRMLLFVLALLPVAVATVLLMPRSSKLLWRRYRRPSLWVLLSGVLLGFTISIRPVGGLAGILVSLYWLRKLKLRAAGLLFGYWVISGMAMYITWPYLWPAPLQRSIASVAFTGGFNKATLYLGRLVFSKSLPWHYFPVLATLELTEPTIPLFLLGTGVTVRGWRRRGWDSTVLLVLMLWFAFPLVGLLAFHLSVYGNLRHLLFVLVPMLLMAGIGIRAILRWLPNQWLRVGVGGLLFLPSLLGIIQMHPYEYGYFNSFSGGPEVASQNFLIDRWCTSYREAMRYVNEHAYQNAIISPLYTDEVVPAIAREDLVISDRDVDALPNAAYHLTCAFFIGGEGYKDPGEWYRVHTVERSGAVLAEIYRQLTVPPWYP